MLGLLCLYSRIYFNWVTDETLSNKLYYHFYLFDLLENYEYQI